MRIFSLLVFLAFGSAWAATPAQTRFQTLNDYFDAGTLPDQGEMMGAWAGRCYNSDNPNTAGAAVFFATSTKVYDKVESIDNGPLFPPAPPRLVFSTIIAVPVYNASADYYDRPDSTALDGLKRLLGSLEMTQFEAKPVDGAYVTVYKEGGLAYISRKYQNYYVTRSITLPDPENRKGSEIKTACYFFKKIMD